MQENLSRILLILNLHVNIFSHFGLLIVFILRNIWFDKYTMFFHMIIDLFLISF